MAKTIEHRFIADIEVKVCSRCKEWKELSEFHRMNKSYDGLQCTCKKCKKSDNEKQRNRRQNPEIKERYNKQVREYRKREDIKARDLEYRRRNSERINKKTSEWSKGNKDKRCASEAKRRAKKLQALPNWLTEFDIEYIKNLYTQARELSKLGEENYHVDHIIPLQGNKVSGLHVPNNLQILEGKENLTKSNKLLDINSKEI